MRTLLVPPNCLFVDAITNHLSNGGLRVIDSVPASFMHHQRLSEEHESVPAGE